MNRRSDELLAESLVGFVFIIALVVLVAWIVELVYDPQLQVEAALVDQVLHQAWWGD